MRVCGRFYWRLLIGILALGHLSLASEIPAGARAEFEAWCETAIARLLELERAAQMAHERARLEKELADAHVDVATFRVRGAKSQDFVPMYFANEWYQRPLERLDPRRHLRPAGRDEPAPADFHSSFFTSTDIESYTPEYLQRENADIAPQMPLTFFKPKMSGTSEGFWGRDARGRNYLVLFDPPFAPEMTTSAEYIGSTLLRVAGYCVPLTSICVVHGTGDPALDGRRAVATIALDHFQGGWRYASFRDRREIRALQAFGGWINNVDQTEQNTGLVEASAGVYRHYILDFGASLGSFTFRPQPARLGWTKLFDPWEQVAQPLNDRGLRKVPWRAPYAVHSAAVGAFFADYDPEKWQPFYENIGFREVTAADRCWAANRVSRIRPEQIRAIVALAGYSDARDAEYVVETLLARRAILLNACHSPGPDEAKPGKNP